jgi:hypothetical protein
MEQAAYLTTPELACRWRLSPGTLRNERAAGRSRVPYLCIGRSVRYSLEAVMAYEREREIA